MAGGGTGGHISPVIAIIDELKKDNPDAEIFFVGTSGGIEEKLIPQTGVKFFHIRSGKFRRYSSNMIFNIVNPNTIIKNCRSLFDFVAGIFDAKKLLKEIDPDVVFLKGGFVCLPLGIACRMEGYPYFLHESDAIMGLANKILAGRAEKVFVSFPVQYYDIDESRLIYSGNPIRKDILRGKRDEAKDVFGLERDSKTILVIGGSQGAHRINELILESLKEFLKKYQLIHITGDYDYDAVEFRRKKLPKELRDRYKVFNFLTNTLKDAYAISDLVITRAGNNILTELAALSKPAVIIPLDSSANNHQRVNAITLSREGAAYVVSQEATTGASLLRQVDLILGNEEEIEYLGKKIHSFYKPDAAQTIAAEIEKLYINLQKENDKTNGEDKESPKDQERE